jgi:hypothetical protein
MRRSPALVAAFCAPALLASPLAGAQSDAESGADVLELAPAPRAAAMAGAYAAGAPDDPFAGFFNPAGIAGRAAPGDSASAVWTVAAAYRRHVGDAKAGTAAARFAGLGGAASVAIRYVDYGDVAELVPDPAFGGERGMETGATVGATELALSAAYGVELGVVVLGAGFDLVRADLADLQDVAVSGSAGARVTAWAGRVAFGAAAQNLGGAAGPGRDAPLPRSYRAGAALLLGPPSGARMRLAGDVVGPWDRLRPVAGVEVHVVGSDGVALQVRAGWDGSTRDGDALDDLAFGGGLVLGSLAIDYAYRAVGVLGDAHQFGVRFQP